LTAKFLGKGFEQLSCLGLLHGRETRPQRLRKNNPPKGGGLKSPALKRVLDFIHLVLSDMQMILLLCTKIKPFSKDANSDIKTVGESSRQDVRIQG